MVMEQVSAGGGAESTGSLQLYKSSGGGGKMTSNPNREAGHRSPGREGKALAGSPLRPPGQALDTSSEPEKESCVLLLEPVLSG